MEKWFFKLSDKQAGVKRKLADGIDTRIFFGEQAMLSVVELAPHAKGTLHQHPEEQWGVLLQGSCTRIQGDEAVVMEEGDFWCTLGNVPHAIHAGPDGAVVLDIFSPVRQAYTRPGEGFGSTDQR